MIWELFQNFVDAVDELDGVTKVNKQGPKSLRVITEFLFPVWAELLLKQKR